MTALNKTYEEIKKQIDSLFKVRYDTKEFVNIKDVSYKCEQYPNSKNLFLVAVVIDMSGKKFLVNYDNITEEYKKVVYSN